ncbi:MAG TPA: ABATE domain-containing protein [Kiloniellales bacterium]|nr:ABATE domain-containing protein [Kiloniellales bacterium]
MQPSSPAAQRPGSRAGRLPQIAGVLALDFCNSASGRGGSKEREHLQWPADLLAWAERAKLLSAAERAQAAKRLQPAEAAALLRDAIALRDAIHAAADALATGAKPGPEALGHLLSLHARTVATARLDIDAAAYRLAWDREDDLAHALLGPIAQSALSLLLESDLGRVKRCGGKDCGWLFFDRTKNRRRRWCEMSVCGNRAKQHRLRNRALRALAAER